MSSVTKGGSDITLAISQLKTNLSSDQDNFSTPVSIYSTAQNFGRADLTWQRTLRVKICGILLWMSFNKQSQLPVKKDFITFLDQYPHVILDQKRTLNNVGIACLRSIEAIGNSNKIAQENILRIMLKNASIEISDEAFKNKM